jgi:hypothetical protein
VEFQPDWLQLPAPQRRTPAWERLRRWGLAEPGYGKHRVYDYNTLVTAAGAKPRPDYRRFPCDMPGWDNAARRKQDAVIFVDSTPAQYEAWLRATAAQAQPLPSGERLVFINAWNEWGEGCYLEPDALHGHAYLRPRGAPHSSSCSPHDHREPGPAAYRRRAAALKGGRRPGLPESLAAQQA